MDHERRYAKTKIFLFFVFAMLTIAFVASVVSLIQDGFQNINNKNYEIKCQQAKYSVKLVSYSNNNLLVELSNQDFSLNITKLTILSDMNDKVHISAVEPPVTPNNIRYQTINNISLDKGFFVSIEDCTSKTFVELK
jgi:hypothetical protein